MRIRSGITLVEVLVAIFIMGIGLLAILVLFPIGAMNMARAIRDDRAAHCGAQAEAIANLWDLRHDAAVTNLFDNPPGGPWPAPRGDTPSYPVLIDPFGGSVLGSPLGDLAGVSPGLWRVVPTGLPAPPNGALLGERWFTFLDDVNFTPDGFPEGTPAAVQRYGQYTWTYIARRPQHGNTSVVDLTVLVYKGRPTLTPSDEPTFACAGTQGDTVLTVTISGEPELRTGGHILDTSVVTRAGVPTVAALAYQVTDVQKDGETWTLRVEPPLRNDVNTVAFLENVIAVFEKGTGWQP